MKSDRQKVFQDVLATDIVLKKGNNETLHAFRLIIHVLNLTQFVRALEETLTDS